MRLDNQSPKRILFIMQLYPPIHGASSVGEQIRNSTEINHLFLADYLRISSTSEKSANTSLFSKLLNFIKLYFKTLSYLARNRYDIVYIAPCATGLEFYKDYCLCMLSKLFCKNIVYHFHNKGISKNKYIPTWVKKTFFRNVRVILSSKLLYYDIEDHVDLERVSFLPYGVADVDKGSVNLSEREHNTIPSIIFFAHMMREKGVFNLVRACAILKDKGLKFHCNFVGGWYDISVDEFESALKTEGIESFVTYLGPQYGKRKDEVLAAADVFAFPTYYHGECFPLSLLEAMKMQLPIVATNEGAIADIVTDGVTGYVVEKGEIHHFASKLESLIVNRELRREMGFAARVRFEKDFIIPKFESRFIEILTDLSCKKQVR